MEYVDTCIYRVNWNEMLIDDPTSISVQADRSSSYFMNRLQFKDRLSEIFIPYVVKLYTCR